MDLSSNWLRQEKSKVSTAVDLDTGTFSAMELLVFYVHLSKLGLFVILSLIYLYIPF